MAKIKIVTDSASDIAAEYEKKYDILILNFKVAMGDKSYTSRVDFDNKKFYKMMDEYDGVPATSQITAIEFVQVYKKLFEQGYTDIICTLINSQGSSTYDNSVMAVDMFFEEVPQAKGKLNIYNIDGRGYTGAYGYPVIQGAKKAKKGAAAKDIVAYIKDWVDNCIVFFAPYTLKYARKSGRIPSAAAFVGEVMGLKPVMRIQDNKIVTETKVRGEKAVIPKILDLTLEHMIPKTPYSIVYGNDEAVMDEMAQVMTKKVGYPPENYFQIGAAIAVNAGPRVVGVIFKAQRK